MEVGEVITLVDEEQNEFEFAVIDLLEVEGKKYAILVPAVEEDEEELEDEEEAVILRLEMDEDGNEILVDLEDEEWEMVADAWTEKMEDEGSDE
ncbi:MULTISPECIES: DUF1292 domain-containing protein [Carboxydothermus]|uniref:UPF0473 protein CHY_0543 n=2 Tax=Carboxydothermus TaxID=129957 RepID=Y543_CARHZ|nr:MULTISPECIES: DUF1292 domain-containing protein [Carboxydothermus]Q3AEN3.1 RecName: Full=UPF0473 protein CHY_0543 [Carboxydothermus hydrogenoformans Z-2901]ABB15507.1 conserved hypothetical protein [Carboxydothermus hydrogenoformans Z-2901]NYE56424.1 uncharacterized protein YrzB (UPF0473 family) [Carboxydothermus ferrireducens DSM 11255]